MGNVPYHNIASSDEWPTFRDDYNLGHVIGAGSVSIVHEAFCKPRREKCAIKRINLRKWHSRRDELNEIQTLTLWNHKYIVKCFTAFVFKLELWLVCDLVEGGSILDILKQKMEKVDCTQGVFDEATIATILKKILKALIYLHSNGQIHRDIKAENILIRADGAVQISGLGLSAWFATGRSSPLKALRRNAIATQCRMAPEVMEKESLYGIKADIWSIGIAAIELATGMSPYDKYDPTFKNNSPTLESVCGEKIKYKKYGKLIREMIAKCLHRDPDKRPSAAELLKHRFFKKAKNRKFLAKTVLTFSPSIDFRAADLKCSKRAPGISGWFYRQEMKAWVCFCGEDEAVKLQDNQSKEHADQSSRKAVFPMTQELITF